ncbi:type VI secretion system protein TssA [Buttiauxella izardii]|uniref:Type VI secretion system protein TssA n=1 Tax=Buttiauxella izardii TaxID=82991 RepID=A0A3A5JYI2_9ENTR|nr:type VI secretion system protein TssA [Buttiauxella izardii]RJT23728.1 type VI secretion system protein TssA [Buttiauxella izardii]
MDISTPHTWVKQVVAPLSEEQIRSTLSESNVDWEYIDREMVKLGSLNHALLNIAEVQQRSLKLLATESKDFRLMVHLLRTLQHTGKAAELILAMQLLNQYLQQFWAQSWPQKEAHKSRFSQQILQRFEAAAASFACDSNESQREAINGEFTQLSMFWNKAGCTPLAATAHELIALYQRHIQEQASRPVESIATPSTPGSSTAASAPIPVIPVENHDDKSWRQTMLKVADLLCERNPQCAVGYRLRRHAIWQSITSAPQAETDGRTSLAAFSVDLMEDYQARLASANSELWEQIEKSLLLTPYWFDGHYLSAHIAIQLGHSDTAEAIRDELNHFLNRIPALKTLLFNDYSPYLSQVTQRWLETSAANSSLNSDSNTQSLWQCFSEQGLIPALQLVEQYQQQAHEPRDQFYQQFFSAQLFEHAGMVASARQQYKTLHQTACQMTLSQWEPALVEQLEEKITTGQ